MKQWTTTEVARLKRIYPTAPKEEIIQQMAPRSWRSIMTMAWVLGIRRRRDWKEVVARHVPVFGLPTDVPVEEKFGRPWS